MAKQRTRIVRPLKSIEDQGAPDISHLDVCVENARQAGLDSDPGPADPTDFDELRGRLETARNKFPPLYRQEFTEPFTTTIDQLGSPQFTNILISDPNRERTAGLMLDMSQAILQRSDKFQLTALDAFEELVSDVYDGFLSAEDRRGINPPDNRTTPPLVKWGRPDFGPYTWPVDATETLGAHAAVVNLPPANARKGLLAWSALGHETAGHDVLHADNGLQDQLADAVRAALAESGGNFAEYWSSRIDETSSDVMGILNMGPAAGIGLVGYFRGLNKAFTGEATLRNDGPSDDPHPADIVRGFLAAETVALLAFSGSAAWSKVIADETVKDVDTITLAGRSVTQDQARESARLVAQAIANTKAQSLEGHALSEIQTWQDRDESIVRAVRSTLVTAGDLPELGQDRIFATHIVAAAVIEAVANGTDLPLIFDRMISMLAKMKDKNPVWGPLFVRHPGNIRRDLAYVPHIDRRGYSDFRS
jgi:hypothetical protein